ncbi:Eco57I restriction-modification methylase domain-containing protein [Leuconostoc mesenteroides]|uniref:Eco57I restriction-modification methylase domain-containing protein n=1 Tax=Leuconostoc mesenteroides TaxID=1245 RepID=UPI00235E7337|nr:Eco57I restriction-modification methylase domain-containing protein [Leuconostoc mesenteroides]
MKSNFDFLTIDMDTQTLYATAAEAEKLYTGEHYDSALIAIRKVTENAAKMVVDFEYVKMRDHATFNDHLCEIRDRQFAPKLIIQNFYDIKKYGNDAAHNTTMYTKVETLSTLEKMFTILVWFNLTYIDKNFKASEFFEPVAEQMYQTAERKLIYIQTGDNSDGMWPAYSNAEKIGDATIEGFEYNLSPNSDDLRGIAERRINQYMTTSGAKHVLQWAELAHSDLTNRWFRNHEVHEVLTRSNVRHADHLDGAEWFQTDLDTAKTAIKAVKEGRSAINAAQTKPATDIVLRPEQQAAVDQTVKVFKKPSKKKMLWNAKMRFGKTLTALELIKEEKWQRVLIMTHRPVVSDSWFEDFGKMRMADAGYQYGSKQKGEQLNLLSESDKPFIYFASIQDLRGSEIVGGKVGAKNELLFSISWDLVIIDEAHEGTQTELAQNVIKAVSHDNTKLLTLSGTPFNLLDNYDDEQFYTWDYVMEQTAKIKWSLEKPNQPNPYESLPKVSMYTFEMKDKAQYADETKSFNFKEFFRVDENGIFVHENDVNGFLNEITKANKQTNYPFSTVAFRNELRHTLWLLPGIKEAAALKKIMNNHPIFGQEYQIINVVDNGDTVDGSASKTDLERVRQAITDSPSETKTITLTVRKLTTGVNVKEWTAVMFLSNTNSAMQYLQAAFRAQTPFSDPKLGMKTNAYIFDFAPDRALTVMAESTSLSTKTGKLISVNQKQEMSQLLNFMPIIGNVGNGMKSYSVDNLLTQIKRVYAEKAVRSGFDDDSLYSDELLMLDNADVEAFKDLQKIVGSTKSEKIDNKVNVNNQGLTQEEYDKANRGEKKPKKQRTESEQKAIDKKKELSNQRKTMISVLRGISIRIPMMIYGMPIDIDEDVDIDTFINNVDSQSWLEFMPKGVTKGKFKTFAKYYDADVFIEAGRIIRRKVKALDLLDPIQRAEGLALIFGSFKNPDKETVLTPWRVVNIHLGKTIGGLSFFDKTYTDTTVDGVPANHWVKTYETDSVFQDNVHILEINSKTGLYPLYAAISLYKLAFDNLNVTQAGKFTVADQEELWQSILQKNIFVVAKTPMAKTITERTLAGYRDYKINVAFVDGIVEAAKQSIDNGVKKVEESFDNMKFDVVIGNPPYQEETNGGSSSQKPIFNLFMDMSYLLADKVTLITPAKFLSNAGGTPKPWNEKMLHDPHFKIVYYEQNSDKIFPRTDIKGGVVVTLRDVNENFGEIGTFTSFEELSRTITKVNHVLSESLSELAFSRTSYKLTDKLHEDWPNAVNQLSKGHKYDVASNIFETLPDVFSDVKPNSEFQYVQLYGRENNQRVYKWIRADYIKEHPNLNKYKVLLPKSNGSGALGEVVSTPLVGTPLVGHTETFMSFGAFDDKLEADNLLKYIKTKFARAMLGVLKVTQDNPVSTWAKVPLQDFTANSDIDWEKSVADIDQQLYAKYGLDNTEIQFIETHVKKMA